jgi:putative FmdB family regulatory protein
VPTYGYHCSRCQAEFEVFQRMTDAPAADCPTCGGPGRRLFYPAGIVFKGSGFYKTDSRARSTASSGSGKQAGSDKTGAATSGDAGAGNGVPTKGGTEASGPHKKAAPTTAAAAEG